MKMVDLIDKIIDNSSTLTEAMTELKRLTRPRRGTGRAGDTFVSGYVVQAHWRHYWHKNVIPINRYKRLRRQGGKL